MTISIIPILIITMVSYNGYSKLIERQITTTASNILNNSMDKVSDLMDEVAGVSQTFVYQPFSPDNFSVIDILRRHQQFTPDLNSYELLKTQRDLKFIFESILYTHSYMNGIYLFSGGGNSFYYAKTNNDLKLDYEPAKADWYKQTVENGGRIFVSDVGIKDFSMSGKPSIAFSRLIVDPATNDQLGVVLIDCSLNIFSAVDKNILPQQANMYITDFDGNIEYTSAQGAGKLLSEESLDILASAGSGQFMDERDGQFIMFNMFDHYNLKLALQVSMKALGDPFMPVRNVLIVIALSCVLTFLIISYFLSRMVTGPIVNLSRIMKSDKSSEVLLNNKYLRGNDEIATLYTEYNAMIAENKAIIKERYQNRIIVLDSQMRALEAQINSHFLYNTLESINSIAEIEGVESISIITKALGDMFRYSIKTDSELVPVEDEINHVLNYLTIQKMRYGDRLGFDVHIDESLKTERILKLILQPVVENAIYHGLEMKEEPGMITIIGRLNERMIEFEIRDDGIGMNEEQLREVERQLEVLPQFTQMGRRDKRSIGIQNIHSRIRLYYGEMAGQTGITVRSELGCGTIVRICVPRIDR